MRLIQTAQRWVAAAEGAASVLAAIVLFAIMLIVSADVAMRYVFNRPFGWTYDLISLYLMGALFYFSLSATFAQGAHISVDVVASRLTPRTRRVLQILIALASAWLFATIGWLAAERTLGDFATGAATAGDVLWPTWLSDLLVPVGCALLTARLVVHALAHAASLATGREFTPLVLAPESTDIEQISFE